MSFIINYIYGFYNSDKNNVIDSDIRNNENPYHEHENLENDYSIFDKKYLINKEELEKVILKPKSEISIKQLPLSNKVNLQSLNRSQLETIMKVKLKPIPWIEKPKSYDPKHPVLKELLNKFKEK